MAKVVFILGTNLGDKQNHIAVAQHAIYKTTGNPILESSVYATAAWGMQVENEDEKVFLNKVIVCETTLMPLEVLTMIKNIEKNMGREKKSVAGYTSRSIDIDILFYDDLVFESEVLSIPHRQIRHRRFVLEPLKEIMPDFVHPILKKTVTQLFELCEDKLEVKKII